MTVSRLESDFQASNMRRTKQGRPTIYPNVTSGHGKRQGARPGSVPYTITKREIKMITMRWDSSFSPLTMAPPWGNNVHNKKIVLMCKYTAIQARAKPKTFYLANRGYFCLT